MYPSQGSEKSGFPLTRLTRIYSEPFLWADSFIIKTFFFLFFGQTTFFKTLAFYRTF